MAKRKHWVEASEIVQTYFETEGRLQRLAENLGVGALAEDPLGCGAWGCAYRIEGSPLVVKITMDDDEGPTWRVLQELRLPGVPYIKEVVELDTPPGRMYAIVREGVDPLPEELERGGSDEDSGPLHEWLGVYRDDARNFYYYADDAGKREQIADHLLSAAAEIQEIQRARDLGSALASLAEAGYPPVDLHDGNLGIRVHEQFGKVGQILFIDPGVTPAKNAPAIERRMAANGPCFFCGDPAAHPSTGVQRTENVLACRRCAEEFETWTRRREKGGRKGEPSFTEASLRYAPSKLEPNVRKKKWVEALLTKRDAIERAIEAPLGKMLGCGHWGCVFDSEPPWVVKLSIDPTEGPIWEKIINLINEEQYGADGFTRVKNVFRLKPDYVTPAGKSHKVWAIVREGVEPAIDDTEMSEHTMRVLGVPTTLEDGSMFSGARTLLRMMRFDDLPDGARIKNNVEMFTSALDGLSKYKRVAGAWHAFSSRASNKKTWLLSAYEDEGIRSREDAEDKISRILNQYFNGPIAGPLGESLSMLASNGVYLRDVHYGNIGWRVPKDDDEWACLVIFDPGHTPTKGGGDIVEALIENGREAL